MIIRLYLTSEMAERALSEKRESMKETRPTSRWQTRQSDASLGICPRVGVPRGTVPLHTYRTHLRTRPRPRPRTRDGACETTRTAACGRGFVLQGFDCRLILRHRSFVGRFLVRIPVRRYLVRGVGWERACVVGRVELGGSNSVACYAYEALVGVGLVYHVCGRRRRGGMCCGFGRLGRVGRLGRLGGHRAAGSFAG